jgi:hypothetical protein
VLAPRLALELARVFRTAGVDDGRHGDGEGLGDTPPASALCAQPECFVTWEDPPGTPKVDSSGFRRPHACAHTVADDFRAPFRRMPRISAKETATWGFQCRCRCSP